MHKAADSTVHTVGYCNYKSGHSIIICDVLCLLDRVTCICLSPCYVLSTYIASGHICALASLKAQLHNMFCNMFCNLQGVCCTVSYCSCRHKQLLAGSTEAMHICIWQCSIASPMPEAGLCLYLTASHAACSTAPAHWQHCLLNSATALTFQHSRYAYLSGTTRYAAVCDATATCHQQLCKLTVQS